jgi:hypothetical protein
MSHETMRTAFVIVALDDLDIMVADIGNEYLNVSLRLLGRSLGMNAIE